MNGCILTTTRRYGLTILVNRPCTGNSCTCIINQISLNKTSMQLAITNRLSVSNRIYRRRCNNIRSNFIGVTFNSNRLPTHIQSSKVVTRSSMLIVDYYAHRTILVGSRLIRFAFNFKIFCVRAGNSTSRLCSNITPIYICRAGCIIRRTIGCIVISRTTI